MLSSELTTKFKTDKIGLIKGVIVFIDGSALFFKEYLDLRYQIDKKAYSFHYQESDSGLLFRYDNALHKPDLGYDDHKHFGNEIFASVIPDLENILEEIVNEYLILSET